MISKGIFLSAFLVPFAIASNDKNSDTQELNTANITAEVYVVGNQRVVETLAAGGSQIGLEAAKIIAVNNQKIAEAKAEAIAKITSAIKSVSIIGGLAFCAWAVGKLASL